MIRVVKVDPVVLLAAARFHHHVAVDGAEETTCGLFPEYVNVQTREVVTIQAACGCGHPRCERPVTCPVCLSLLTGKMN